MKANVGNTDRAIRILIAAIIAILYYTGNITGVWAIVLLAVAGVFALTSFISFCPLYYLLGINSRKETPKHSN